MILRETLFTDRCIFYFDDVHPRFSFDGRKSVTDIKVGRRHRFPYLKVGDPGWEHDVDLSNEIFNGYLIDIFCEKQMPLQRASILSQ